MTDLEIRALNYLLRLLHDGYEYPDASAKVCMGYGITQEHLGRLYDDAR